MHITVRRLTATAVTVGALLSPSAGVGGTGPGDGCPPGWSCPRPEPVRLCPPDMTPVPLGCYNGDGTLLR
jgi:hypothetical protein